MRIYATPGDLAAWTGAAAPANAAGLLRSASALVEAATLNDRYATGGDGLPASAALLGAFEAATCEQAAFWAANGLDPAAGALGIQTERVASSKAIKGASVSYDTADATQTKAAKVAALSGLCEAAYRILRNAGLASAGVR